MRCYLTSGGEVETWGKHVPWILLLSAPPSRPSHRFLISKTPWAFLGVCGATQPACQTISLQLPAPAISGTVPPNCFTSSKSMLSLLAVDASVDLCVQVCVYMCVCAQGRRHYAYFIWQGKNGDKQIVQLAIAASNQDNGFFPPLDDTVFPLKHKL